MKSVHVHTNFNLKIKQSLTKNLASNCSGFGVLMSIGWLLLPICVRLIYLTFDMVWLSGWVGWVFPLFKCLND